MSPLYVKWQIPTRLSRTTLVSTIHEAHATANCKHVPGQKSKSFGAWVLAPLQCQTCGRVRFGARVLVLLQGAAAR